MAQDREQIIKQMQEWSDVMCKNAPCKPNGYVHSKVTCDKCIANVVKTTVSLFKELTEENERLKAENEALAISEVKECEISQMLVYRIRDKHPAVMAVISDTARKLYSELYEEFLKVASCQKADEPNMRSQEVFAILEQKTKEILEGK